MTKVVKIIIIAFSTLIFCINVDNFKPNENYDVVKSIDNASELLLKSVLPFKCREEFLWHRLDLRLWKRRRRMSSYLSEKLKEKTVLNTARELKFHSQIQDISTAMPEDLFLIEKFKERWPVGLWRKYGLFTDTYLLSINPHWLQFPPPDPRVQYALGSLYLIMLSIGCFGNILVLFMYFRYVKIINQTDIALSFKQLLQQSLLVNKSD